MKKLNKLAAFFAGCALFLGTVSCSGGGDGGSSPNPSVNKNKDGTVTITIQEGQYGLAGCNGVLKSGDSQAETSSNGKYYANFPSAADGTTIDPSKETAQISYIVNTDTAGDYLLKIRYAFGGNCDYLRDAKIYINGVAYNIPDAENGNLNFDYTIKNWTKWAEATATIPLEVGDNSIVLKAAIEDERKVPYNSGWANWDKADSPGKTVRGVVVSLPNIDYMSLTSPVKNPAVKLAAGAADSAYYSLNVVSENKTYGKADASYASLKSGSEVTITATPDAGYKFDCWHGSIGKSAFASNEATYKFTLTGDTNLKARFIPENYVNEGLSGYATVADDNGTTYTVTGGTGGNEITIASLEDLTVTYKEIIKNDEPYIIHVAARISAKEWIGTEAYNTELAKLIATGQTESEAKFILDNRSITFDFGANKTIIGEPGKDYGFHNINPKISKSNVIVKYIHFGDVIGDDFFGGSGNDALSIKGGQHIWIDHCEFSSSLEPKDVNGNAINFNSHKFIVDLEGENTDEQTKWKKDFYDGLLDVSETSRFVSVSNCYFHDHWKACLCGGSNDKAETQPQGSQVRMTFYRNYFKNIHARQPLFRFGRAHIFSSFYDGAGDSTGIEVRAESRVYVDNCYFQNISEDRTVGCWNSSSGLGAGKWTVKDCTGASTCDYAKFTPPYDWSSVKLTAAEAKEQLPLSAGIPASN